jgi:SAM-dependent methyltransferase
MAEPSPSHTPARYEDVSEIFRVDAVVTVGDGRELDLQIGEDFGLIEEEFGRCLDESLSPRGPESLFDLVTGADPPPGGVAVDNGCGNGRDTVRLVRRFALHVHGVDPVPSKIERAKERAADEGLEDMVDLQVGRAEAIPLPDASVDVLWCKEVLTFTDLEAAMREFHRVMRPNAFGVVYKLITGPAMSKDEARGLAGQEMGFGPARSLRPADVEAAISTAGLVVLQRVDYASEWGETGQERDNAAGRRLVHAARLLRQPQRYIDRYGEVNYRIMLADCLWHVYRMIGKLWGVAFVIARSPAPPRPSSPTPSCA